MRRDQGHVTLIVEQLALFFGTLLVRKLPATDGIAHCDDAGLDDIDASQKDQRHPRLDHDLMLDPWVTLYCDLAVLRHFDKAREDVVTRDAHVVEAEPAVVSVVETKLGAKVTDLYARHGHVVLDSSDLYNKWFHAVVAAVYFEPSKYNGVS